MAKRLYSEFTSTLGAEYVVEIHDTDFVGDATQVEIASCSLNVDTPSRIFAEALMPTTFDFSVIIEDPDETFRDDIVSSSETRFSVLVKKDGDNYWAGALVPDIGDIEDKGPEYQMNLKAVCGLGLLEEYEYLDETTTDDKWTNTFTGFDRLISVVARCLKKLPHIQTHYTGIDPFLLTSVNWYHSGAPYDTPYNTNDPLYNVYVLNSQFSGVQTSGNAKPMSCAKVIESILDTFNARIIQTNGRWLIEQYESRITDLTAGADQNRVRSYAYAISAPSISGINPSYIPIDPASDNIRKAGGSFGYAKAAKSVMVTLDAKTRVNLTQAMRFDETSSSSYNAGNVFWDGIASTFRAKGTIAGTFTNTDINTALLPIGVSLIFNLRVNLAGNYLDQTFQSNWPFPDKSQMVWSGSAADVEIAIPIGFLPAIGDSSDFSQDFDFVINTPTGTQGNMTVAFELDRLVNQSTGATLAPPTYNYDVTWDMNNPYFAIYYDEQEPIGKQVYEQINTAYLNQGVIKVNTILGDAVGLNDLGALRYLDGSDYLKTLDWSVRDDVDGYFISQLLGRRILQAQSTPRNMINATLYGPDVYQYDLAIEYESVRYVFMGGTFYPKFDELQGRWIELRYEDITISSATNSDTDTSNYNPPATGSGTVNQNQGTGQAGADGNGIYTGSGTVPSGTVATIGGSFSMTRTGASAGDKILQYVDDGSNTNQIKVQAGTGIVISSTGDTIALDGETAFADVISASTINANQNDYAALDGGNTGRVTSSADYNITGISGGSDGRIILLHNIGSNNITLKNADTGSSAANRFDIGADFTLLPKKGALIQYDGTSSRWRIMGAAGVNLTGSAGEIAVVLSDSEVGSYPELAFDGQDLTMTGNTIRVIGDGGATIDLQDVTNPSSSTQGGHVLMWSLPGASLSSGDRLGVITFAGNTESNEFSAGAEIMAFAEDDWNSGDAPTKLSFYTTPDGSTTPAERVAIKNDGTLDVLYNIRTRGLHIEDYNEITGTGTVTASSTVTDNLYNNGSTQATLTFELPDSPTDGQICRISFADEITALTVDGNGETIISALPSTAAAGESFEYKYYDAIPGWIRKY